MEGRWLAIRAQDPPWLSYPDPSCLDLRSSLLLSSAMGIRVVCISRTLAAGGEEVGQAVAARLGFRYWDEQIIQRAARQAQVDPELVAATERRQPVLRRVLDKLSAAADLVGPLSRATGLPLDALTSGSPGYRAMPEDLRLLIRAAIHEVARAGNAVIVAHAASMALGANEGILRVLVTASPATRAQRLAAADGITVQEATAAITASDRERLEYFQRFYQIDDERPTHYDLVVNTDAMSADRIVDWIAASA